MNAACRIARMLCCIASCVIAGCADDGGSNDGAMPTGTREELMNPQTCEGCHPKHFREWSSSMHAYAAQDPVFLAMNQRGQRETDGELGDFCVNCHAPMAVREGFTTDGLNLDEVPDHLEGVTCYFCHNVVEVTGTHNAALELADDTTMRGGIMDPVSNSMHGVEYSTLLDSNHSNSSKMCGACHDIVTPKPHEVELERTFQEWSESVFSKRDGGFLSCASSSCHMDIDTGVVAENANVDVPARSRHEHLWPGVDVAMTDFPDVDVQLEAIRCALYTTVTVTLCPSPTSVTVRLEANAGHKWPSGAAQDRRAWLELLAFDENDELFWSTGQIADDQVVDSGHDPNLWVMRDRIFDAEGHETHMFWEAASFESSQLPTTVMFGVDHGKTLDFPINKEPHRIEARVRIRPMDYDVLQDLVDSKDLDPEILEKVRTFTLQASVVHWSKEEHDFNCTSAPEPDEIELDCPDTYRCMLDPDRAGCP